MSFLATINNNGLEVITAIVVANFSAQFLKTITNALQHKEWDLQMLFTTGGMPSSHSASVTAMMTTIGLIAGVDSIYFAIAFCLTAVVMYDSAGVRRSAGKQAEVLNNIIKELFSEEHKLSGDKLKELLGHSPYEVLVGALYGAAVSVALRYLIIASVV